jgi:hypothetical protein
VSGTRGISAGPELAGTVSTMRATASRTRIEDAASALRPFYEAGDDGYPVSLALDALAKALADKADVDLKSKDALVHVLGALKAPSELRTGVEKLYKHAAGGEYGLGLSKKQANAINALAEELVDPLVEYIKTFAPGQRPRSSTRSRPVAKRKKR